MNRIDIGRRGRLRHLLWICYSIIILHFTFMAGISSAAEYTSDDVGIGGVGGGGGKEGGINIDDTKKDCTEIARDDETLLVFSTLGGGLIAVDPQTSEVRWSVDDEPAVNVPTHTEYANPQYLPDPRDGSLYQLGDMGGLKKLPYTIPQLVASAPCRSSDGILYSGKKSDTWYLIDPKTGQREKVLEFGSPAGSEFADKIGWATSRSLYLGRTQYTVMMYDSLSSKKNTKPWNVTFFDYSAHSMTPEVSKEYEWLHLTASASGMTVTLDRSRGTFMWQKIFNSPVVATFLMGADGLLSVPFTTVSDDTLKSIVEYARDGQKNDIKLFQTLYVGEHPHGLYAIPSLADRNIATISSDPPVKLLDGPNHLGEVNPNLVYLNTLLEQGGGGRSVGVGGDDSDTDKSASNDNFIVLGHYQMPKLKDDMKLSISGGGINGGVKNSKITTAERSDNNDSNGVDGNTGGNNDELTTTMTEFEIININRNGRKNSIILPQKNIDNDKIIYGDQLFKNNSDNNKTTTVGGSIVKFYQKSQSFWHDQESKILKFIVIIMMGLMIAMLWYMRHNFHELRQSQSGSQTSNGSRSNGGGGSGGTGNVSGGSGGSGGSYQELIDLGDGEVKVGKICFNSYDVLGKGCEGTFVFKGTFEKRNVAVKRLLPECFTLADREVTLLRESDAHENVVRYFCTEQDRQFRYIAVELCAATLQDYIENGPGSEIQQSIPLKDVLKQATSGIMHLHSLNIVHRDIKPQNVLLSLPNNHKQVRAMISDFGLCKKLNFGKTSFSRRSGVTGTEGWIAPEMLKGQRTTTSVDIFSLGCVYYYVLSNGMHPFGEAMRRQSNILSHEYDLKIFQGEMFENSKILAEQLIISMISKDPLRRPPTKVILNHPFFWNEEYILSFLQDVSDRVEKLDYSVNPLKSLEKNGRMVVRNDWNIHLHEPITADLRKYRGYHGNSVRDLLRALRNKKHHYHELTHEMQMILGSIPIGFTRYWIQRFPYLVSHSFHALESCSKETIFKRYYNEEFTFIKPEYFYDIGVDEFIPQEQVAKQQYRDSPNKKYGNNGGGGGGGGMRRRNQYQSDLDQEPIVRGGNKRGTYNFYNKNNGGGGGGSGVGVGAGGVDAETNIINSTVVDDGEKITTNWRRRKNSPNELNIKWTLPNNNQ